MTAWNGSAMAGKIQEWADTAREAAGDAVFELVEQWLEEGNRIVPIEEGTLQNSGVTAIERDGNIRGAVGWGAGAARAYAVRQHEDLSLNHDSGRAGKWGETSGRHIAEIAGQRITDAVKGRTGA